MWITSEHGQRVRTKAIQLLSGQLSDPLAANTALRKAHPELAADQIAAALDQATLFTLASDRYGIDATALLLTRDGLEQGTRPEVATFRAQLIKNIGAHTVIDMSAGLGFDVRAFIEQGLNVIAIERDPVTAAYLRANAPEATIIEGDSITLIDELLPQLSSSDVVFVDPARRSGRRTLDGSRAHPERDPERWSPSWSFVTSLAQRGIRVCAKVAPGFSPTLLPSGWSGIWTSMHRDGVEAMVFSWSDGALRTARMIDEQVTDFSGSGVVSAEISPILTFLYEPDVCLVNAQLLDVFCHALSGLQRIDADSSWLTSHEPVTHPMVRRYQVLHTLPNDIKALRKSLVNLNVGDITIKSKGMNINTDALRKELKLPTGSPGTIVITTARGARTTVLVHHDS